MLRAETVRQDALRQMSYLSKQLGSETALIDRLVTHGVNESWSRKFLRHETNNPTIGTLDRLMYALSAIEAGEQGEE